MRVNDQPLVCCLIMARDEADWLPATVLAARAIADELIVVDTGSGDATREVAVDLGAEVYEIEWIDFGRSRTDSLRHARGRARWILELDADMTVVAHPELRAWLEPDPLPEVQAWLVSVSQNGTNWRLPRLLRGDLEWQYREPAHAYLDTAGRVTHALRGLELQPRRPGGHDPERFERNLILLAPGVEAGEPRATFYSAETLRFLGRSEEAIALYRRRAEFEFGFEEERWYAAYMAARLADDVKGLIKAWEQRPWRHEPLTAAARIVGRDPRNDLLFLEPPP